MLETKYQPIAPMKVFLLRLLRSFFLVSFILSLAIIIGVIGFHFIESMSWLDSFMNSAMILSTMGPVVKINTDPGKIFASFYALFSGLVFVSAMGIIFTPMVHRLLHHFHNERVSEIEKFYKQDVTVTKKSLVE